MQKQKQRLREQGQYLFRLMFAEMDQVWFEFIISTHGRVVEPFSFVGSSLHRSLSATCFTSVIVYRFPLGSTATNFVATTKIPQILAILSTVS